MNQVSRRELEFDSLDDAVSEAKRLLADGYLPAGNWNLAQVLGHCSDWLSFPMDGYPRAALPIRVMLWMMKISFGKSLRAKILKTRQMKSGGPTMPATVKKVDELADAAAVGQFAKQVERFKRFQGPLHASPLFGKMSRQEMQELQIIHLQHHLSFLVPKRPHP